MIQISERKEKDLRRINLDIFIFQSKLAKMISNGK